MADNNQFSSRILDINYVHFLQFQRDFISQAELEASVKYIIHKPIDLVILIYQN